MRCVILLALVTLSAGCVPVTEPVGDVDKAEPDKALVGDWTDPKEEDPMRIDVPVVKGNPKGLMRLSEKDPSRAMWFYTTKIGKHTYAVQITGKGNPQFGTEGDYAKWQKNPTKHYYIARYTVKDDEFTLDAGDSDAVELVMRDAKIEKKDGFYATPEGWLAGYLKKNDGVLIFDGTSTLKFSKTKKK